MPIDVNKIWVFRIIPFKNLENNLRHGLHSKNADKKHAEFISIGSEEVIKRRDTTIVKCFEDTVVNDYVPFYFSVRTPMLYNVITGHGVPKFPQEEIIYLCCKLTDLATDEFQWCYTNGNAATKITRFFRKLSGIEEKIDWRSIRSTDFRDDNEDGDEDRGRKKHAEFLVKDYVPAKYIKRIVVLNEAKKKQVEKIIEKLDLEIEVFINPEKKFYFL